MLFEKVKEMKQQFLKEESRIELPKQLKQKILDEILERLRGLRADANVTEQRGQCISLH